MVLRWNKCATFQMAMTCHLTMTLGALLMEHPSSLCLISLHLVELLVPVDAEGINSSLVAYTTEYTYLLTHLLTPCSRLLLEKLTSSQL